MGHLENFSDVCLEESRGNQIVFRCVLTVRKCNALLDLYKHEHTVGCHMHIGHEWICAVCLLMAHPIVRLGAALTFPWIAELSIKWKLT